MNIDRVVSDGCHLVAKSHFSNREDNTEFRFSSSLAEITLIHTWSNVQKYIYHILRQIKAKIAQQCAANGRKTSLCTYYFKTLMLWACENRPPEFWDESRLEKSVGELLYEMVEWLLQRRCPNYFIPDNNMFDHFPDHTHFEEEILMLFKFNERRISDSLHSWPMVSGNNTLPVQLSRKLLALGQMGFTRNMLFIKSGRKHLVDRYYYNSSSYSDFVLAEFKELYSAIEVHLKLVNSGHDAVTCAGSPGCMECDLAMKHFEEATTSNGSSEIHFFALEDSAEDNLEKILFHQHGDFCSVKSLICSCSSADMEQQRGDESKPKRRHFENSISELRVISQSTAEDEVLYGQLRED